LQVIQNTSQKYSEWTEPVSVKVSCFTMKMFKYSLFLQAAMRRQRNLYWCWKLNFTIRKAKSNAFCSVRLIYDNKRKFRRISTWSLSINFFC
jgi:hypothetical protein